MKNRGKLVYCQETFQVFPSAKAAADHLKISYLGLTKHLEGCSKTSSGKHFIYIENTADLSNFFASKRQEVAKRRQAEERLNKLLEAEQSIREQQATIAKQIAEARKMMRMI
jgi:hypothetical protein